MLTKNEVHVFESTLRKMSARLAEGEPMDSPVCSSQDLFRFESLAYSLYRSGNYAHSKTFFHRLILSKPLEQSYWMGLGACLQVEKSYAAALKVWGVSSILDGNDPLPHFHAAHCNFALNDVDQGCLALKASKKLLKPHHRELRARIEQVENDRKIQMNQKGFYS